MQWDRLDETLAAIEQHLRECVDITARGRERFFGPDFVLRNAAHSALVQTGNAIKNLPAAFIDAHHDAVSWRLLTGVRDKTGHAYGDVIDWQVVWNTIAEDVPKDLAGVRRLRSESAAPDA